MTIYIDADAFPNVIKDILIRASERLNVPLVFVANKPLRVKKSANISVVEVGEGADVADDRIASLAQSGNLIITSDIPLADRVIAKGAFALTPRGELYNEGNIKDRLSVRDLLGELRDGGMITGGPAAFSKNDRQAFANQLDSFLVRQLKIEESSKKPTIVIPAKADIQTSSRRRPGTRTLNK
jgi:uncharacterized protein YaiI (UPF0178 family)